MIYVSLVMLFVSSEVSYDDQIPMIKLSNITYEIDLHIRSSNTMSLQLETFFFAIIITK